MVLIASWVGKVQPEKSSQASLATKKDRNRRGLMKSLRAIARPPPVKLWAKLTQVPKSRWTYAKQSTIQQSVNSTDLFKRIVKGWIRFSKHQDRLAKCSASWSTIRKVSTLDNLDNLSQQASVSHIKTFLKCNKSNQVVLKWRRRRSTRSSSKVKNNGLIRL